MRINKKGFTLTELIVVIAIIAILSAVLIPSLTGYIGKAKLTSDQMTIKNINNNISWNITSGESYDSINEVLLSLDEEVRDFIPQSKDYYYCFDYSTYKFFLTDKEYNIVNTNDKIGIDRTKWIIFTDNVEMINNNISNNLYFGYFLTNNIFTDLVFNYLVNISVADGMAFNAKLSVDSIDNGEMRISGNFHIVEINTPNANIKQYGDITNLNIIAVSSTSCYINGNILNLNFGDSNVKGEGRIVIGKTASITYLNNFGKPNSRIENMGLITNHQDYSAGTFINQNGNINTAVGINLATYSFSNDYIGKDPTGINISFYNDIFSRGFSWFTDNTITNTDLFVVKSNLGEKANFSNSLTVNELPNINTDDNKLTNSSDNKDNIIHRAYVEGLESNTTYSYKLGSSLEGIDYYVYGTFKTESDNKISILSITDSQTKDPTKLFFWENTIATAISTIGYDNIDFIAFGGDLFDSNLSNTTVNRYNRWQIMHDTMTEYTYSIPFAPTSGNHDSLTDNIFINTSNIDYAGNATTGGYYSFKYLNLFYMVLNSNDYLSDTQLNWAREELEAANNDDTIDWIVVLMHNGLYSTGDHSDDPATITLIEKYAPIFSKFHVDLVLQGHDHTYAKSNPYLWDSTGYSNKGDTSIIANPETVSIGGITYDNNPQSTYYITINAAGHRVGEDSGEAFADGYTYYSENEYEVSMDTINVGYPIADCDIANGDRASANIPYGVFGELVIVDNRLVYKAYIVLDDGTSHLFDTLAIVK